MATSAIVCRYVTRRAASCMSLRLQRKEMWLYVNKFLRQGWLALGAVLLVVPVAARSQQADAPLLQRSLFADRKAHRVGDMLTVVVTEAASATATARTRADKEERVFGEINQPDEAPWNIDLGFGNEF